MMNFIHYVLKNWRESATKIISAERRDKQETILFSFMRHRYVGFNS